MATDTGTAGAPIAGIQSAAGRTVVLIDAAGRVQISPNATPGELREAIEYLAAMFTDLRGRGATLEQVTITRREHALESDPYAFEGKNFADIFDLEALRNEDRASLIVRQRILDDVHASHRLLDALSVEGGPLTARIGLALGANRVEHSGPTIRVPAAMEKEILERIRSGDSLDIMTPRRARGPVAVADVDDVKIPDPETLFAMLDQLNGEELFRLFDSVKVLPPNTLEARPWDLMNTGDVRDMMRECCQIALDSGRLGELATATRELVTRKGGT